MYILRDDGRTLGGKDVDDIRDLHGHLYYMNFKFPLNPGLNFQENI